MHNKVTFGSFVLVKQKLNTYKILMATKMCQYFYIRVLGHITLKTLENTLFTLRTQICPTSNCQVMFKMISV